MIKYVTMETKVTPENDPRPYIGYDLMGFPYNSKYPPNKEEYGNSHEGYKTKGEGVLLYDYVVMGYDVEFTYNGQSYYLLNDGDGILTDKTFKKHIEIFPSPMDLVENLKIEGVPLLNLAPHIEDIEPV